MRGQSGRITTSSTNENASPLKEFLGCIQASYHTTNKQNKDFYPWIPSQAEASNVAGGVSIVPMGVMVPVNTFSHSRVASSG